MREDGMEGMKKKKGRGKERRMAEDWTREEENEKKRKELEEEWKETGSG